jgi:hypothetical protein
MSKKEPTTVDVVHHRDGLRIGPYEPHVVYTVPADEAERLITVKGFEPASPATQEEIS